jgi:hypothetical protein
LAIVISGLVGTTIVAAGGIIVALINARSGRATTREPVPGLNPIDPAEIRRRLDDSDEARELIDRRQERQERAQERFAVRLERIENHLDQTDPGWRRGT